MFCLGIIPKCQQGFPKLSKLSTAKEEEGIAFGFKADCDSEIALTNALPVTKFDDNKVLGRIVIRREGTTIGAGTVIDFSE